jgi:hypothetical protein
MGSSIVPENSTKQRKYENGASAFSDWLRSPEVSALGLGSNFASVSDLDFIWFVYPIEQGWYITIEEKCFGAQPGDSQKDVLNIITTHLLLGSERKRRINTWRKGKRVIEYRGHYTISFEKTHPNDSDYIMINGKKKTKDDLIQLLTYGHIFPQEVIQEKPIAQIAAEEILSWDTGRQYDFLKSLIQEEKILVIFQEMFKRSFLKRRKRNKPSYQESIF